MKKLIGIVVIAGVIFILLHSTSKTALRFHLLFMGYPKEALITEISDNKIDNRNDKKELATLNAETYTLSKPPFEKDTETELDTFLVRKIGFLYFAEYYSLF
ncbi:hypothetical protein [Neobacillus soli]|uniref:hypothetical protein n=1 Tax=Neobacillus soli TaxID=220688 RepID=UPI0011559E48|nr:hypothetical protein [Neobacillus soli]